MRTGALFSWGPAPNPPLPLVTRADKLTKSEYDETTWSARTWKPVAVHKISVAAHRSMPYEIAHTINLRVGSDPRVAMARGKSGQTFRES